MNPDIFGPWHATLDTGSAKVKLLFTVAPDARTATLRGPNLGGDVLPLALKEGRVGFDAEDIGIVLDLALDAAGQLTGVCRDTVCAFPISFARGPAPPSVREPRPQTPEPPFPYTVETVSFAGADGELRPGTLTRPPGAGPVPAVVLSAWGGPTDRDQTTAGHRPMALWADLLTRAGLATLRYDKRGMGDFERATTGDLAADLACAVGFLRAQPGVDAARIGLIGHSEGGHISADVAAPDPAIAGCVMLTPTGVPEEATLDTEMFRAAIAIGATLIADPEPHIRLVRALSDAGRAPTAAEAVAQSRALLTAAADAGHYPRSQVERRAAMAAAPWRRYWWAFDSMAAAKRLACPVLAVFAELDLQTAPAWHAPAVRAALAGNPRAEFVELRGLNHFLQTARTGAHSEYGDIQETLAPMAIETVVGWVTRTLSA